MRLRWREYLPLERTAWALQFQVLVLAALRAAWMDHGACLKMLGYEWRDFSRQGRLAAIRFLDGLEKQESSCGACPPAKAGVPPLGELCSLGANSKGVVA
jgi:hypothetical protein